MRMCCPCALAVLQLEMNLLGGQATKKCLALSSPLGSHSIESQIRYYELCLTFLRSVGRDEYNEAKDLRIDNGQRVSTPPTPK